MTSEIVTLNLVMKGGVNSFLAARSDRGGIFKEAIAAVCAGVLVSELFIPGIVNIVGGNAVTGAVFVPLGRFSLPSETELDEPRRATQNLVIWQSSAPSFVDTGTPIVLERAEHETDSCEAAATTADSCFI